MSTLTEKAKAEADEVEQAEPDETEEEEAAEGEPEPEPWPEPEAVPQPPALTEQQSEREFAKLERKAQTYLEGALAIARKLEIPVQLNGKLRSKIVVALGAVEEEVIQKALADEKVQGHVAGKQIVKRIFTGKLVNIVVR